MQRIQHSQTREKLFNINCQRKRTWYENHKKNNTYDHDDSKSSKSISLWYCWNDHLQHYFRIVMIKIAQLKYRLKKEIIHIWEIQLRDRSQIYASTAIDDKWKTNDIESVIVFDKKD